MGVREIQCVCVSARLYACMCVCVLVRAIGDNVWLTYRVVKGSRPNKITHHHTNKE
jgi:hypothetical protein